MKPVDSTMQSQAPGAGGPVGKKGVSLLIAILMLVAGVAAGAGIGYAVFSQRTSAATNAALCYNPLITNSGGCVALCTSGNTVTIGELLDLSKDLSSQGTRAKDSSTLAINDINSYLSSGGCSLRFATAVDDYQLDSSIALTQLTNLHSAGVQVVVGPLNSGAAQNILGYANNNHIVLISPSSTAVGLAIPNDYLFRTAPNDRWQGQADARMMYDRGARAVIIVQRHDPYGDALANSTGAYFKLLGGTVVDTIPYPTTTTDFTNVVGIINTDYTSANRTTNANRVAIDAISFEEFGSLIAKANSAYPYLLNGKLPWFGTDGEADDTVISGGSSGSLVAQVTLPSTVFGFLNNSKTLALYSTFSSKYPGVGACDSYCLGAYDDVWLAALSTIQAGSYDGAAIQANMLTVAANFYGVTGQMTLEPSGDRVATAYTIWKVINQGTTPTWIICGTWSAATDTVTWTSPPPSV